MDLNATLLGQMTTFAVFVWFTMKFIWPGLMSSLEERRKFIADGLAKAEQSDKLLLDAKAEYEQEIVAAKQRAEQIVSDASKRAQRILEEARLNARKEHDAIVASGHTEVEMATNKARQDLRSQLAELVVAGAGKIIEREISTNQHKPVIDELLAKL